MPVYEYECNDCGKITETLRRMNEADEKIACTHCGSTKTARTHSVFATGTTNDAPSMGPGPCGTCGDPRGSCGV
ncbi:MAG: FmdB family transcriptional regulator [Phycisphaeraceae bacterium]|nr:FmdB family transcriptional regulator [Phycisphaeraceae bacterium]